MKMKKKILSNSKENEESEKKSITKCPFLKKILFRKKKKNHTQQINENHVL